MEYSLSFYTPEAKEEKKDDPLAFVESLAPDIKERVFSLVQERDAALQRDARLRGQLSWIKTKLVGISH